MKFKMGRNNRITEERFRKIKAETKLKTHDKEIMARFNIGRSTLSSIKRAKTYADYLMLTRRKTENHRPVIVITPPCGLPFIDYPMTREGRKMEQNLERRDDSRTEIAKVMALVAIFAMAMAGIIMVTIIKKGV